MMTGVSTRVPVARRLVLRDRGRLAATLVGVGMATALMLLLIGIYRGVRLGAVSYIESQPADLWVARAGTGNLLRSTSYFAGSTLDAVGFWPEVASTSPLLRVLVRAEAGGTRSTLFLFGFDPNARAGRPRVVEGTGDLGHGDLIVDRAFARRRGLAPGDSVFVDTRIFRVAGISDGTNALVAQYAFGRLDDVQDLASLGTIVSFGIVGLEAGSDAFAVADELSEAFGSLEFIPHTRFVDNNVREMDSGVLPVLWAIAVIGLLGGFALITLLLHGAVADHRRDYALLMSIGFEDRSVAGILVGQALLLATAGFLVGAILIPLSTPVLSATVPELALSLDGRSFAMVGAAALILGLVGSLFPLLQLRRIYPGEVFRA